MTGRLRNRNDPAGHRAVCVSDAGEAVATRDVTRIPPFTTLQVLCARSQRATQSLSREPPHSRLTFASMSGVMLVVAMLTTYVPEYRASSVDPMLQALRGE